MAMLENKNGVDINNNDGDQTPKKWSDLANVQVVLTFLDKSGFVVPLTPLQGAFLVRMLGFAINQETGELTHYTDLDLNKLYQLLSQDDVDKMMKNGDVFDVNP